MDPIVFQHVTYKYPETEDPVFRQITLSLPPGMVSLIGQNGTGKSTLLLLAGGSLLPDRGDVFINGINTRELRDEKKRQEYVSFIYQNLEFETEDNIGDLLEQVYGNGFHKGKDTLFINRLIDEFKLDPFLNRKMQELSKGELQRTILAFSLLYGSRIIMMDEPIFALEDSQKMKSMAFIREYAKEKGLSVYFSVHELDISEKFSDYIVMFENDRNFQIGPTPEMWSEKRIEELYGVPFNLLKKREALYREGLKQF
ncbi:MAG: ABC transporter ATP-binding protein [Spirochaetales bacterium]|nr:ABC transporter ATP-binding protein [Spirochaetales bacterium]